MEYRYRQDAPENAYDLLASHIYSPDGLPTFDRIAAYVSEHKWEHTAKSMLLPHSSTSSHHLIIAENHPKEWAECMGYVLEADRNILKGLSALNGVPQGITVYSNRVVVWNGTKTVSSQPLMGYHLVTSTLGLVTSKFLMVDTVSMDLEIRGLFRNLGISFSEKQSTYELCRWLTKDDSVMNALTNIHTIYSTINGHV